MKSVNVACQCMLISAEFLGGKVLFFFFYSKCSLFYISKKNTDTVILQKGKKTSLRV